MNALILLCESPRNAEIVKVAQFLIDKGIKVNHRDEWGMNALMLLCLESNSGKMLQVIQLLITKGININQMNKRRRNAARLLTKNSNVPESKKREIIAFLNMYPFFNMTRNS